MGEVKVVVPPSRDGGVVGRVVSDGTTDWVETWRGSERGWVKGGFDVAGVMMSPPVSSAGLKRLGIPSDP